jgi:coenzyme F420 hydrogenase subunit beta
MLEEWDSHLASTVKLTIGLVCDRTLSLAAVDYLLRKADVENPRKLVFRDKGRTGYPGDVTVQADDGQIWSLPRTERMAIKDFFTPARCRLCFDKMNVLADVTVGDPWGIDRENDKEGESVVPARTKVGHEALVRSREMKSIDIRRVPYEQIIAGQNIDQKRTEWGTYCSAWNQAGRLLPDFCTRVASSAMGNDDVTREGRRELQWSLKLDEYSCREALLRSVKLRLAWRRLKAKLSSIPRRFGRLARHLLR